MEAERLAFAFEPEGSEVPRQQSIQAADDLLTDGNLCPDVFVKSLHPGGRIHDIAGRPILKMINSPYGTDRELTSMKSYAGGQTVGGNRLVETSYGFRHLQRRDAGFFAQRRVILRAFPNRKNRIAFQVHDETVMLADRLEQGFKIAAEEVAQFLWCHFL